MPHTVIRTEWARLPLYAALLAASVTMLLGFTYAAAVTQHAVGIYSQGQARWIQAHVQVVGALRQYAATGDAAALDSARASYRIPDAYRRAREALEPGAVDRDLAVAAFMDGEMTRSDAERAALFGPRFGNLPTGRKVLDAWREGEVHFDSLRLAGTALQHLFAQPPSAERDEQLEEQRRGIDRTDAKIAALEAEFAAGLARTARMLPPVSLGVGALLGILLIAGSLVTVGSVARAADRARADQYAHFQRLNSLMDGVPDLIVWVGRDGRYTHVNAAVERFLDMPRERILAATDEELAEYLAVDEQFFAAWKHGVQRAFAGHDESLILELPDVDGKRHVFQFRLAPQREVDGSVSAVMAAGRDLTELRESEAALREREQQLRNAQKLEAVGRLAGGVAHEFNNILTAVTANIELALLDLPPASQTRKELGDALTAARRAGGLTRQLLVLGRRDEVDRSPIDVGRLAGELEPMLQRVAGDSVSVVTTQHVATGVVMADAGLLQQILFNLVSNGRDAMTDGGILQVEVGIATTEELREQKSVISGDPDHGVPHGRWVTLMVRDSGTGMQQDVVDRLFEPFFTTKPPGSGSGLGLPVVNGIVLQLGGCICVETEPGRGSAITVALPEAAASAAVAPGHAAVDGRVTADLPPSATPGRGELVLLVEDEAAVRVAARRMLEHAGYHVVEAKHAEDAVLQWEKQAPDVVVTDFMMPGLTGGELLVRLRERRPGLRALIISGYTGGDTIDVEALGANTMLLQKPFTRTELLERLRELLDTDGASRTAR